jgi:hypothetical protein
MVRGSSGQVPPFERGSAVDVLAAAQMPARAAMTIITSVRCRYQAIQHLTS